MVEKYYKSRIYKLKKELENNNSSSSNLIILKDENIFYLTGFYAKDSESILLLIDNDLYLLVNFIYLEQAKKTVRLNDLKVIQYNKNKYKQHIFFELCEKHPEIGQIIAKVTAVIFENKKE